MRYAFISEKQVAFPIAVLCRVLDVSRSGFYDYLTHPVTDREVICPRFPWTRKKTNLGRE